MPNTNSNGSASDQAGSPIAAQSTNPNVLPGSATGQAPAGQVDYKNLYEQLEQKLGVQGQELGEYRSFFEGVSPLLDRLDKSPDLVQAILNGKVDENLAKAALENKISVGTAEAITQAHAEVKQDLGAATYKQTSPEDIAKLVEARVAEVETKMRGEISEIEEARVFEQKVNEFISQTPDFSDYASEVEKWLDQHSDITDIETAYFAVKGKLSIQDAAKRAELEKAEHEKNLALNAGGGAGSGTNFPEGVDPIDVLVASKSNPNVF